MGVEEDVGVFGHDLVDEDDAVLRDFRVGFGFWGDVIRADGKI